MCIAGVKLLQWSGLVEEIPTSNVLFSPLTTSYATRSDEEMEDTVKNLAVLSLIDPDLLCYCSSPVAAFGHSFILGIQSELLLPNHHGEQHLINQWCWGGLLNTKKESYVLDEVLTSCLSSARETIARVAAGSLAKKILKLYCGSEA
ncbi:hypothetical protein C5167_041425 [Papaver somniferum]|nr:hypothetical protein C5167_041425 [Papaver somniferum]